MRSMKEWLSNSKTDSFLSGSNNDSWISSKGSVMDWVRNDKKKSDKITVKKVVRKGSRNR